MCAFQEVALKIDPDYENVMGSCHVPIVSYDAYGRNYRK